MLNYDVVCPPPAHLVRGGIFKATPITERSRSDQRISLSLRSGFGYAQPPAEFVNPSRTRCAGGYLKQHRLMSVAKVISEYRYLSAVASATLNHRRNLPFPRAPGVRGIFKATPVTERSRSDQRISLSLRSGFGYAQPPAEFVIPPRTRCAGGYLKQHRSLSAAEVISEYRYLSVVASATLNHRRNLSTPRAQGARGDI
ncbi:hypothetical protein GGR27_002551 [Lewinella antarctica]|uniref:Uncharacterized protein n=1 Tax=Neolewinella antarctica TaxID=442734 RepID=A0ABX0XCN4_9BACT|nr:hypothetical protein [Neolewinella antarctica]